MIQRLTKNRLLILICASCLLLLVGTHDVQAQQLSLKTNALMDALMTPNLGFEVVTGDHSSIELSGYGHTKPYGLDSKLLALQPEYKFWFNGRPMTREYIGVAGLITTYDMTISKHVYDGDAVGLGLTGGYVFNLSSHWNLELSGGFGVLFFRQKQYHINDNYDDYFVEESTKVNASGYKLFPMKLGVTFSYILK